MRAAPSTTDEILSRALPMLGRLREAWVARLHGLGVSLMHHHVISILAVDDGVPMGRLAERMGVSLPSASGIVERLVEHDLVARDRDDADRRIVRVRLTPAGRRLVRDAQAIKEAELRRLIARLDVEQQRRLLACVHDLQSAAGWAVDEGSATDRRDR